MATKSNSRLTNSKVGLGKTAGPSSTASTMKTTKPMNTASDFSKHIKGLQHHADENIEDEYIKNLQQQIGYMELELKLLKEKEIEAKQSVSQIDKFFNDGVPLNENILALKNQYNHAKKEAENRMDEFQDKKMAELKLANDQKSQYEKLSARLKDLTNEMEVKEETFTKELHALRTQFWDEKHTREDLEKELKELEMLFRAKTDENLQMTRTQEREAILNDNRKEKMANQRLKTAKDLEERDKWITGLQDELQVARNKSVHNPELSFLEKENRELTTKINRCDKEAFSAKMRVNEMEELLKDRQKEREIEADQKRTLIAKINHLKSRIDEENKVNELVIQQKVKEKEDRELRELQKKIEEVKRDQTTYKGRQKEKEDNVDRMSQDKIHHQQELIEQQQLEVKLEKELKEKFALVIHNKTLIQTLIKEEEDLKGKLKPLQDDNEKYNKIIPMLTEQNEDLVNRIAHLETLNQLSLQLKNVNLEELKLLTESNDHVLNTINDLTKKWDTVQRQSGARRGE